MTWGLFGLSKAYWLLLWFVFVSHGLLLIAAPIFSEPITTTSLVAILVGSLFFAISIWCWRQLSKATRWL